MTNIEWTDKTWNPIVGCSKISPACDHCYAERMAARLALMPNAPGEYANVVNNNGTWSGGTAMVESALEKPLHWRKPYRVFVGSMTDLFHPSTPFKWLTQIFDVMFHTPHITYQILTKRPDRMQEFMRDLSASSLGGWPFPNVWLGVTVENQEMADKRIPILLDTPAAVRFVSVEPMLGAVDLTHLDAEMGGHQEMVFVDALTGKQTDMGRPCGDVPALDWVICGGETGPGARPAMAEWLYDLKTQCVSSGVPFFFKHWGTPYASKQRGSGGRVLDGEHWEQFPETCEA